jgi:hypothetical protein
VVPHPGSLMPWSQAASLEPNGCNYKPAEKYCCLIFCERKILFWLKKQAE